MTDYDADVIVAFADRLYREAARIVIAYTLAGLILRAALAGVGYAVVTRAAIDTDLLPAILGPGGLIGGLLGYLRGGAKASELKLRAQLALCQVEIERHTRRIPAP